MKKKILASAVCAAVVLSLTACGKENPTNSVTDQHNSSTSSDSTSSKPVSSSAGQTSSTPEQSSAAESKPVSSSGQTSSTPDETSKPENENKVDWASVPYAAETDFKVRDVDGGVQILCYLGSDKVIKIPETIGGKKVVTVSPGYIGEDGHWGTVYKSAFKEATHVKLPDSVSDITGAFCNCPSLVSANIPNSVATIGLSAFECCTALSSIEIPSTVTEIGSAAFATGGFESLTIPDSVKVFSGDMIVHCANLKEISLPQNISIAPSAPEAGFYQMIFNLDGCGSLTNTDFLKNVKPSGTDNDALFGASFENCKSLTSVTFPDGILCVGSFGGCENLTEITLPNSVISVGSSGSIYADGVLSLSGCKKLKKITLSDNLKSLKEESFSDCPKDLEIVYKGKTYKPDQASDLCKAINGN